jgi:hypothetical protein
VLHLQTADPFRTPTYTIFPKPDYFFSISGPNVSINSGFGYNHGYSPNIDITWSAGYVVASVAGKLSPLDSCRRAAVRPRLVHWTWVAFGFASTSPPATTRDTVVHAVDIRCSRACHFIGTTAPGSGSGRGTALNGDFHRH